jgi:hypothetical protein
MSKSEYKRLSTQAPELVATIKKEVLREVLEIILKEPEYIATSQEPRASTWLCEGC